MADRRLGRGTRGLRLLIAGRLHACEIGRLSGLHRLQAFLIQRLNDAVLVVRSGPRRRFANARGPLCFFGGRAGIRCRVGLVGGIGEVVDEELAVPAL